MKKLLLIILLILISLSKNTFSANIYGLQYIQINKKNIYFETRTLYDLLLFEN